MMNDKARAFLLDHGYTCDQVDVLTPMMVVQRVAKLFGHKKIPKFSNRDSIKFLNCFFHSRDAIDGAFFRTKFTTFLSQKYSAQDHNLTANELVITNLPGSKFYKTREWKELRYRVLDVLGNTCMACGRSPKTGAVIHVDHILPRSVHPEKALSFENMQVLCDICNEGKSNKWETKWATKK